jgi:hypothetical protein
MNGGPTCRSEPSEDRFVQRYSGIDCDRKIKIASGAEAVTKIRKINAIDFLTEHCEPPDAQLCLAHSQMPCCIVDIVAAENAIFAVKQGLITPLYFYLAILYSEVWGMARYASSRMGRISTRWN